jgi:hypothetical protein
MGWSERPKEGQAGDWQRRQGSWDVICSVEALGCGGDAGSRLAYGLVGHRLAQKSVGRRAGSVLSLPASRSEQWRGERCEKLGGRVTRGTQAARQGADVEFGCRCAVRLAAESWSCKDQVCDQTSGRRSSLGCRVSRYGTTKQHAKLVGLVVLAVVVVAVVAAAVSRGGVVGTDEDEVRRGHSRAGVVEPRLFSLTLKRRPRVSAAQKGQVKVTDSQCGVFTGPGGLWGDDSHGLPLARGTRQGSTTSGSKEAVCHSRFSVPEAHSTV